MAQIAMAKLLSPSHAAQSVSLYNEFKQWCELNNINIDGFKGFQANIFGCVAENSLKFKDLQPILVQFFDELIDTSSNKLVTAVAHYITNPWVIFSADLYIEIS